MTRYQETMSAFEFLDGLDGRLTYRMFDHWVRNHYITLEYEAHGSGTRRRITLHERRALIGLLEEHEKAQRTLEAIRSGRMWAEMLRKAEIAIPA